MILVLEDVNGQFEKPFLYYHDVAFCLGCPIQEQEHEEKEREKENETVGEGAGKRKEKKGKGKVKKNE